MTTIEKKNIDLGFFTSLDLRQRRIAHQLLGLIYDQGREFAPELFDNGKRLVSIGPSNLDVLVEQWTHFDNMTMRRETQFESEVAVTTLLIASRFNTISIWVEEKYFELQSRTEDFLQLSIAIYDLLCPVYGNIHQTRDAIEMATVQDPRYGKTIVPVDLRKGLPGIYWANFFGPEYVELIGRRKLLSAPCEDVRELSDGGILILTASSPLDPCLEINRTRQQAIRDYLGEDLFYHWGQPTTSQVPRFRSDKSGPH